jgi:hypothetical protein
MSFHSVLIIVVTGGTGLASLRQLANHPARPEVHASCRDPSRLADADRALCGSIFQGDARKAQDIEQSLLETGANVVILSTGTGESAAKSDIRTATGESLVLIMKKPRYQHVKAVIVSGMGASHSRINVGYGWGMLYEFYLRNVIADHNGQEAAFHHALLRDRTLVLRPTLLTVTFGDKERSLLWKSIELMWHRGSRAKSLAGSLAGEMSILPTLQTSRFAGPPVAMNG